MTDQIFDELCGLLNKPTMSGKTLLARFRMLDESSRDAPSYSDPRYAPFYYYLGRCCPVKRLVEIGFGIGIATGSYVRGCQTVQQILALQETGKNYYSPRIGIHNVRDYFRKGKLDVHVGRVSDYDFERKLTGKKWDLGIINNETYYDSVLQYLDVLWENLNLDGTIVVDYVSHHESVGSAYRDFCRRKNRQPKVIPTRYGVGVITK